MWALTSSGRAFKAYMVVSGTSHEVANLGRFERTVNQDQGNVETNPLDLAPLGGGRVLVADAAANALLVVSRDGSVDWVATFPPEDVSTANAKSLAGCPDAPPDFAEICELPETIPAEAVPTTVAIGPDGPPTSAS
jgi:hypothetical protein